MTYEKLKELNDVEDMIWKYHSMIDRFEIFGGVGKAVEKQFFSKEMTEGEKYLFSLMENDLKELDNRFIEMFKKLRQEQRDKFESL